MTRRHFLPGWSVAAVALLVLFAGALPNWAAEHSDSVESGRKALARSSNRPWYDAKADAIGRVHPEPPRKPAEIPFLEQFMTALFWVAIAAVLAGLVYVLIQAYLRMENLTTTSSETSKKVAVGEASRIESLPFPMKRDESDLLAAARRHYELGNYAEAIIYLFSYELIELDRHQLIHLARGKTNRQYLREMARRPPLRGLLEQTMVTFEDVFFGNRPLDRSRFEACWSRLDEFATLSQQVTA
jgi:hypothetical protein